MQDQAVEPAQTSAGEQSSNKFSRRIVAITAIKVDPLRLQGLDRSHVDLLAKIAVRFGLRDPITITAGLELVGGINWFAAAQALGLQYVEVIVLGDEW
jgi:ParB-like chromosome segregation protein Spo0J